MPEMPEVENVKLAISSSIIGRTITDIRIRNINLRKKIPDDLILAKGCDILDIDRKSKYLIMHLSSSLKVVIHLGMTGKLIVSASKDYMAQKHDHCTFIFDDGTQMSYVDPRRFGMIDCFEFGDEPAYLKKLGLECDSFIDKDYLKKAPPKMNVKAFLLDQTKISGIGNIYASEILFASKISPFRFMIDLSDSDQELLLSSVKSIIDDAIKHGGSTIRDYSMPNGSTGSFQQRHKVYGRVGASCFNCGCCLQKIKQAGRSTFYCPNCQK